MMMYTCAIRKTKMLKIFLNTSMRSVVCRMHMTFILYVYAQIRRLANTKRNTKNHQEDQEQVHWFNKWFLCFWVTFSICMQTLNAFHSICSFTNFAFDILCLAIDVAANIYQQFLLFIFKCFNFGNICDDNIVSSLLPPM